MKGRGGRQQTYGDKELQVHVRVPGGGTIFGSPGKHPALEDTGDNVAGKHMDDLDGVAGSL